jgi:hypothetical protein
MSHVILFFSWDGGGEILTTPSNSWMVVWESPSCGIPELTRNGFPLFLEFSISLGDTFLSHLTCRCEQLFPTFSFYSRKVRFDPGVTPHVILFSEFAITVSQLRFRSGWPKCWSKFRYKFHFYPLVLYGGSVVNHLSQVTL